jgi:hypothetical protein
MRPLRIALALLPLTLVARSAGAVTCPFVLDSDDNAVFYASKWLSGTPDGNILQWNQFVGTTYLRDGSWDTWTKPPPVPVDLTRPATKMANALMLVGEGHWDTWVGWHPASQYLTEAIPRGSYFHNDATWQYSDTISGTEAMTTENILVSNVSYWCQVFGTASAANSATERGATMVHEQWHLWQYAHGFDMSHGDTCNAGTASCDFFFPHTQIEYLPGDTFTAGDLNFGDPGKGRFHTPYQIGAEYECDLSQFSQGWVPLAVTGASGTARFFSNFRTDNNFMNAVAWRCGNPLPFD